MQKRYLALILIVIVMVLSLFGCGVKVSEDPDARLKIKTALIFPFNQRVEQYDSTTNYTSNTNAPDVTIGDFEFEIFDIGELTAYSPKSKLESDDFNSLLNALKSEYGEPTYTYNLKYLWVSEDGNFELNAVYDTGIFNNVVIGVNLEEN